MCGIALPDGLRDGSRLPEPIFTPATKAPRGEHDENITFDQLAASTGAELAAELRRITLAVYERGAELAAERGIIVADTKIELGFDAGGTLTLGDEVLTPDSSRFWPADQWQPGAASRRSTSNTYGIGCSRRNLAGTETPVSRPRRSLAV